MGRESRKKLGEARHFHLEGVNDGRGRGVTVNKGVSQDRTNTEGELIRTTQRSQLEEPMSLDSKRGGVRL